MDIFISILQKRKQKVGEVKWLAQGLPAKKTGISSFLGLSSLSFMISSCYLQGELLTATRSGLFFFFFKAGLVRDLVLENSGQE